MITILNTHDAIWGRAKKTKAIKAAPLAMLFKSVDIAAMFLVNTLEAKEPVSFDNLLCVGGEESEPWQQATSNFFKKYSVVGFDSHGWMICEPLPENEVQFFISTVDGYISAKWGETVAGINNLQKVRIGDAVARQTYEHKDQWVVNRRLWNGTYTVL